jgi:CRP-like cAMP-binding protein
VNTSFKEQVFLQDFTNEEVYEIIKISQGISFKKDDFLFKENETGNSFFIIISGNVEVFAKNKQNERVKLANLSSGHVLGEVSFIDSQPRTANVVALDDVEVLLVTGENFAKLEENNVSLAIKLIKDMEQLMVERLRDFDQLLVDFNAVKVDDAFLQKISAANI